MAKTKYEDHSGYDGEPPVIFHRDHVTKRQYFGVHWHENIELLFFIRGRGMVTAASSRVEAGPGDIAVINSSYLHMVESIDDEVEYYCLIVKNSFLKENGIAIENHLINALIQNRSAKTLFEKIIHEMSLEKPFYQTQVRAYVLSLMVLICRRFSVLHNGKMPEQLKSTDMIKKVIRYIQNNYTKELTISKLAQEVGYSKYYICHIFKEITGYTIINYINYLRCKQAQSLIQSGKYNVGEAAVMCGFENLSYFTKTFKKHMGILPTKTDKL